MVKKSRRRRETVKQPELFSADAVHEAAARLQPPLPASCGDLFTLGLLRSSRPRWCWPAPEAPATTASTSSPGRKETFPLAQQCSSLHKSSLLLPLASSAPRAASPSSTQSPSVSLSCCFVRVFLWVPWQESGFHSNGRPSCLSSFVWTVWSSSKPVRRNSSLHSHLLRLGASPSPGRPQWPVPGFLRPQTTPTAPSGSLRPPPARSRAAARPGPAAAAAALSLTPQQSLSLTRHLACLLSDRTLSLNPRDPDPEAVSPEGACDGSQSPFPSGKGSPGVGHQPRP